MRKAHTQDTHEVAHTDAPDITPVLTTLVRSVRDYERRVLSLRHDVENYKRQANSATHLWSRKYHELKGITRPEITADEMARAHLIEEALRRHVFIESIGLDESRELIKIYTRLLFADVRLGEGQRTTARRCIGAYSITLPVRVLGDASRVGYNDVKVRNILFTGGQGHWGLRHERTGHSPCWGEWQDDIMSAIQSGNLYEVADKIILYLRTSGDSGAYTSSHEYVARRFHRLPEVSGSQRVREGSMLALTEGLGYINDELTEGRVYRIDATRNGCPLITLSDGTHECLSSGYTVLSPKMRKAIEHGGTYNGKRDEVMNALDALPNGATLTQAREVIGHIIEQL